MHFYFVYRYREIGFVARRFYNDFRHIRGKFIRPVFRVSKSNVACVHRFAVATRYGTSFHDFDARKVEFFKRRVDGFRRIRLYAYSVKGMRRERKREFVSGGFFVFIPVFNEQLIATFALVMGFRPRRNARRSDFVYFDILMRMFRFARVVARDERAQRYEHADHQRYQH